MTNKLLYSQFLRKKKKIYARAKVLNAALFCDEVVLVRTTVEFIMPGEAL